jgi:hypothetical protein
MARSSQSAGMPTSTLIALALGAMGLIAFNKIPLQDTRPTEPPAPIYWHSPLEAQDIEARLWEDPLAAVARVRSADPAHDTSDRHKAKYLRDSLAAAGPPSQVLVLGVFVTGAPYAEDIEARRRARYAVVAGLHRAGFVPQNSEHVGYFLAPGDSRESATVVVYEALTAEHPEQDPGHALVLLLWLDQDSFRAEPLADFGRIVTLSTKGLANGGLPKGRGPAARRRRLLADGNRGGRLGAGQLAAAMRERPEIGRINRYRGRVGGDIQTTVE